MNDIDIKTIWTNAAIETEIENFRYVVNTVFGPFCSKEHFKAKYLDNIYGPSVLFIAYIEHQPVGACSLWRNDLDGEEAYLAADACVLPSYRGQGIYSAMLMARSDVAAQRNHALIYTFPNTNSYPRLVKKKWNVRLLRKVLFIPGLSSSKKIGRIEKQYAEWWLKQCQGICHLKLFSHYYLIKTVSQKGFARVLGTIDQEVAVQFPKPTNTIWLLYGESEKVTFYNKRWSVTPIAFINGDGSRIPFWKMDSL